MNKSLANWLDDARSLCNVGLTYQQRSCYLLTAMPWHGMNKILKRLIDRREGRSMELSKFQIDGNVAVLPLFFYLRRSFIGSPSMLTGFCGRCGSQLGFGLPAYANEFYNSPKQNGTCSIILAFLDVRGRRHGGEPS